MTISSLPPTINLHGLVACNFECGFCYAGFDSAKRHRIPQSELHEILRQIAAAPKPSGLSCRKVTFAGGEPLLSPSIVADIATAKELGHVTSLVTNGSRLTAGLLNQLAPVLDWLTISIDSLVPETNRQIGRSIGDWVISGADYLNKINAAHKLGIRVKINTVVNRANLAEDFSPFIQAAAPRRWKLFQATRIAEENGDEFDRWAIDESSFMRFVERHGHLARSGIVLVPETQDAIYGTYAMVGPNGCFFDNSQGTYRYSQPIVSVGVEAAFAEVSFSAERFRQRLGDYDFATGTNRTGPAR